MKRIRITENDIKIVHFINRFKFARSSDVAKKFNRSEFPVYRRLAGMTRENILTYKRFFFSGPGVYYPTAQGVALLPEETIGPIQSLNMGTYRHDLAVLQVAIDLELQGKRTASERELRSMWTKRDIKGRIIVPPHVPDLAVIQESGKLIYYEIELTTKSTARLQKILNWYSTQRNLEKVIYLVATDELAAKITELARKAHVDDIITTERMNFNERNTVAK